MGCQDESQLREHSSMCGNTPGQKAQALPLPAGSPSPLSFPCFLPLELPRSRAPLAAGVSTQTLEQFSKNSLYQH